MSASDLWELFRVFAPMSFGTIGGGVSALAEMQRQMVDVHHWMSETEFTQAYAVSRLAPGPGSLITVLFGWKVAGLGGAIVATFALLLPTSILICALAAIWSRYRGSMLLSALETGLRPVAAGLILAAVWVLLGSLGGGWLARGMALASGALLLRSRINPLLLVGGGAAIFLLAATLGLAPA